MRPTFSILLLTLLVAGTTNAQTVFWPTYNTEPAIYNDDECVQLHDIAIVGKPNAQDVEFICLTPFAAGESIHFYSMELKNGAWNPDGKDNVFTFSSNVGRGTFVRAIENNVQMSLGGSDVITNGGGTWTTPPPNGNWNPEGKDKIWVASFNTVVDPPTLTAVMDYIVVSEATAERDRARVDFLTITGGLEVPLSSLVSVNAFNDFHYVYPSNVTGNYGKGWPGFLEARRDLVNWTSIAGNATRAAGWDGLAATWDVVTPASEALLLVNQGSGVVDDSHAGVLLEDASIDSLVIPTNTDLNLSTVTALTKPMKVKPGRRLGVIGASPSGPKLVLESSASGTAGLGTQTSAVTMDSVIIERHIGGTTLEVGNGFVNGGSEVSWVNIGNLLPGLTAGDVLSQLPQVANLALYQYDTATGTYTALTGTAPLSSPWDATPSYDGYFLLLPSNADGYTLRFAQANVTIPADEATLTIPLETSGLGWNLLVNPFASAISVSQLLAENEVLTVEIYGGAQNLYNVTNRDGSVSNISTIESGQAFWVNSLRTVSGDPLTALTLTPSVKTASSVPFIREQNASLEGVVRVTAYEENQPHLPASTYIAFNTDGEVDYDPTDLTYSSSMSSSRFEIWTSAADESGESKKLLVQSTGDLAHSNDIPLVIEAKQGGNVMVKLEEHELGLDYSCARLSDLVTGETWQLSYDSPISLAVEPNVTYTDRFFLNFSATPQSTFKSGFCSGGVVELSLEDSGVPSSLELVDVASGEIVTTNINQLSQLAPGDYHLSMEMVDGCVTEYSFAVSAHCMGELNDNDMRDVQDLMGILTYIGNDSNDYDEIDSKGIDCDCDQAMTNMDILTFLSAFGQSCD